MIVISLFDGIGGAYVALRNLRIACDYFSSEIDKYALQILQQRCTNIHHLSDVRNINTSTLPTNPDLLIGGSPCQNLSGAKMNREGLEGRQSSLFYYYLKIRDEIQPKNFILENVASMSKADAATITKLLGVKPVRINSKLFVPQLRDRLYWCDFVVNTPQSSRTKDLADILEDGYTNRTESFCLDASYYKGTNLRHHLNHHKRQLVFKYPIQHDKIKGTWYAARGNKRKDLVYKEDGTRLLTPEECEELQGFPLFWTDVGISNTQRYKGIGNGFTVPVIQYLLEHIV